MQSTPRYGSRKVTEVIELIAPNCLKDRYLCEQSATFCGFAKAPKEEENRTRRAHPAPAECGRWRLVLKLRDFGKIEVLHLHRGDDHVEGFLAAGADRGSHGLYIGKHVEQAFVKPEI